MLGPHHYGLITKLNYLGRCLKRMGRIDESAACYTRSAGILRQLRENASPEQCRPAAAEPGEVAGDTVVTSRNASVAATTCDAIHGRVVSISEDRDRFAEAARSRFRGVPPDAGVAGHERFADPNLPRNRRFHACHAAASEA